MLPPVQHLRILVWPDGCPVDIKRNSNQPVRSPRARYAHNFENEAKRTNFREQHLELGLRRATVRIEVTLDGPEPLEDVEYDMRQPGEAFCAACPDHEACVTGAPCSVVRKVNEIHL